LNCTVPPIVPSICPLGMALPSSARIATLKTSGTISVPVLFSTGSHVMKRKGKRKRKKPLRHARRRHSIPFFALCSPISVNRSFFIRFFSFHSSGLDHYPVRLRKGYAPSLGAHPFRPVKTNSRRYQWWRGRLLLILNLFLVTSNLNFGNSGIQIAPRCMQSPTCYNNS